MIHLLPGIYVSEFFCVLLYFPYFLQNLFIFESAKLSRRSSFPMDSSLILHSFSYSHSLIWA